MPTLEWIGKSKVINHHQEVPYRILERRYSYGDADNGNMIIHGDNLDALKALLPRYEGQVKCVYIDPPYNTGNEGWVYNDNVNDPKIRKWLGEVVGKEGEDLTRHDKWLCMMYPRLRLLYKLLSDDGVIFISIDDTEVFNLKSICDEIFGCQNFLVDAIWQHSIQPKGYLGSFSIHHNHTLIFQKTSRFRLRNLTRTDEDNKAYKNPDNDPRGPWRSGDVRNALYRPNLIFDIVSPSGNVIHAPEKGWRWSKETIAEKIKSGEIIFNRDETGIIRKIYLDTVEGRAPESIWFGKDVGTTREANGELKQIFGGIAPFDTPKPSRLIERILQIATDSDSVILDSFAGSGTTAHAVLNMNKADGGNRKFILVEMEDYADSITAERVKRVMAGYGDGKNAVEGTGGGFSFYDLGEPLMIGGELNEAVDVEKIREYIWFMDTRQPYVSGSPENPYLLGVHNDTARYFYYKREEITTLNYEFLSTIPKAAGRTVIYADRCAVSDAELDNMGVTFRKIPRDIARL